MCKYPIGNNKTGIVYRSVVLIALNRYITCAILQLILSNLSTTLLIHVQDISANRIYIAPLHFEVIEHQTMFDMSHFPQI